MPASKRSYSQASTTTIAALSPSTYDTSTQFNHVAVVNDTDGTLELYFGQQTLPDLLIPEGVTLAFDGFLVQGQCYIRNSTGTGGDVTLYVWRYEPNQ
jgi:hypothetical protein